MEWKSTDNELPEMDDDCIVALKSDSWKKGWIYGWWGGYLVIDNYRNEKDPDCKVKWWMKIEKPE